MPAERERDLQQRQGVPVGLPLVGDLSSPSPLVGVEPLVDGVSQVVRAVDTEFRSPVVDLVGEFFPECGDLVGVAVGQVAHAIEHLLLRVGCVQGRVPVVGSVAG
ncbi:MAG: hypothetical protein R3324_14240, partial [Halobacteriales archaeon]|nr:hypothetical protein [Halobacteriales archaeon]